LKPALNQSDSHRAYPAKSPSGIDQGFPDLPRLWLNGLSTGPPSNWHQFPRAFPPNQTLFDAKSDPEVQDVPREWENKYQDSTTWGVDRGFRDLDIRHNDDMNALSGPSPVTMSMAIETGDTTFGSGGYYVSPVTVRLPVTLEPLPPKLLENPMNLLVSSISPCILSLAYTNLVLCEFSAVRKYGPRSD